MSRRPIHGLLALALVGGLFLFWRAWQAPEATVGREGNPVPVNAPATNADPLAREQAVQVARLDPSAGPRALPPPSSVEELAARAGAGDAVAACQLAAELADCRELEVLLRHARTDAAPAPAPATRCDALLAGHADRHFDLLRQAAHAGEPEAMLRYARGEGFGISGDSYSYLRSPHFDAWRRESPAMLQSLLDAGYPEAAIYRMLANDGLIGGPLANLLPSDPVQDRAYQELFLLLNEDSDMAALLRMRDPSESDDLIAEQARQRAERWHQENFGGRTFDFTAPDADSEFGLPLMRTHGRNCSTPVGQASP